MITAFESVTSMSTDGFRWCFEYAPRPALSLRFASIRRTCHVAIKAAPKTTKPRRITTAAISPPSQWKAVLAAELVAVADGDVEVAVVEVVDSMFVDSEFDAVEDAAAVVVVFTTTSLRTFVKGSFARAETTQIAKRHCSRASDGILGGFQAVEMLDREEAFDAEQKGVKKAPGSWSFKCEYLRMSDCSSYFVEECRLWQLERGNQRVGLDDGSAR